MSLSFPLHRPPRRVAGALCALAVGLLAAGCGGASSTSSSPILVGPSPTSDFSGIQLPKPLSLGKAAGVAFRTDTNAATDLGQLQTGHLLLVYFGYTHCPDVCPTTMADLGSALRQSSPAVQKATRVVFISSDPVRDTVPVLHAWLKNFDGGLPAPFIGLRAQLPQVDAAAHALGVPLQPPVREADGTISVTHGAEIFAFSQGQASIVWLAGTSPSDYAHDLAALAKQGSA